MIMKTKSWTTLKFLLAFLQFLLKAREQGVKKCSFIAEAKKCCPQLVLVNGEDLSKYRKFSQQVISWLNLWWWNNVSCGLVIRIRLTSLYCDPNGRGLDIRMQGLVIRVEGVLLSKKFW